MTRHLEAVLFDLDGTLIDSTPAVRAAWTRWACEEGVDPARLAAFTGRPAKEIVAALVPPGRADGALAAYTAIAEQQVGDVVLLPGAREALLANGDRTAIVTSSSRTVARARMAAAGLPEPAVMVTAEDVERGKPEPEPYLTGARLLGVDARHCLAVEDTGTGIASAAAAGCVTVAVGPVGDIAADIMIPDLREMDFRIATAPIVADSAVTAPGNGG